MMIHRLLLWNLAHEVVITSTRRVYSILSNIIVPKIIILILNVVVVGSWVPIIIVICSSVHPIVVPIKKNPSYRGILLSFRSLGYVNIFQYFSDIVLSFRSIVEIFNLVLDLTAFRNVSAEKKIYHSITVKLWFDGV